MGAACTGLQFIEFRTHYHPDDATYIELGKWFGNCKQYPRIIDAFRAGLLLAPDSTELFYLLGLTLYTSGDPKAAMLRCSSLFKVCHTSAAVATRVRFNGLRWTWGSTAFAAHECNQAVDPLRRSLDSHPSYVELRAMFDQCEGILSIMPR